MRQSDAAEYFRGQLSHIDEPTAPFGLLDVRGDGSQILEARQELEAALSERIRGQAQRLGMSAAALFHAAWALVVARTSGRDEVVFGSVLSGRLQGTAGEQQILGMFINTLPLRVQLQGQGVEQLVRQTHSELVKLLKYEQVSLAEAQRCSGIKGAAPLFTSLLNYRHTPPEQERALAGMHTLGGHERTNYPLTLSVDDLGAGFVLTAQTDRRLEPQRLVGYLHTAVQGLIEALERAPARHMLTVSILPETERRQVLEAFNETRMAYPGEKLIHELFEEQVERTPRAPAVVYEQERLSYEELNRRANQVAHYLREQGVGPDQLVGLCVERSVEMVVGLLGILKAGGAYVPLDPGYPRERLSYMLADAAPGVVLTQERLRDVLPETSARVVTLDGWQWSQIGERPQTNPVVVGLNAKHLAYVIYTSGSTGQPKGVMLEHAGLCNLVMSQRQDLDVQPGSHVLQFASLSFDAYTWEWITALSGGACCCLASREDLMPGAPLLTTLRRQRITHTLLSPSVLSALPSNEGLESLSTLIVGGEACPPELARRWAQGRRLLNAYGPTESTVYASMHRWHPQDIGTLPIGRPIANTRIYILDEHREPVGIGITGEIYIGGAGVARGYLNRAELTQERFVRDPFSEDPQARIYKTGDLGRWQADGNIEYLGRNDSQVKIRGFRIELGEIEAQLSRHAGVREAVVLAREDRPGEKRLVGYVTRAPGTEVSVEELRAHVQSALPEYMVPGAIAVLESLPLTANGKLDRKGLPAPDMEAYARQEYEAPRGELEETLAGIWQQLLSVERVGRHDNFFALGGHSLLAVQFLERLPRDLPTTLPLTVFFEKPTIRQLSDYMSEHRQNRFNALLSRVTEMSEDEVISLLEAKKLRANPEVS
jgi:amino acid adenylation domain-containing protein